MASKRQQNQAIKSFPLQYLSEDKTDEFDKDEIAKKLYELVHFYKVHKSSINHIFLEKHASDFREHLSDKHFFLDIIDSDVISLVVEGGDVL